MTKAEKNKVRLNGSNPELLTDLTLIIKSLKQHLIKEYGNEEAAEKMIKEAIDLGFKSDEEVHKKCMDKIAKLLDSEDGFERLIKMLGRI